jgi:hypothetical protein
MLSKEDHDKIFPEAGLVNHQEFKKRFNTGGLYSPFVLASHLDDMAWFGSYNYAPIGFREITVEEFAQKRFEGFPILHEDRQLFYANDGTKFEKRIDATITLFSGNMGYALERDYWKKTVRYYAFEKCKHNWVYTRNLGRCYNEYVCEHCGSVNQVDSSD